MLAERRGGSADAVRAVGQMPWDAGVGLRADGRMGQTGEEAALIQMRILGEVLAVHAGEGGDFGRLQGGRDVEFRAASGPYGDDRVEFVLVGLTRRSRAETVGSGELGMADDAAEFGK